jgi:23S rRNA (cytosine1962-C5)-methyltransferase
MKKENLIVGSWDDYELIDSGGNRKLERYGSVVVIRPETQAIWEPLYPEAWQRSQAEFTWELEKGTWKKGNIPESWRMAWGGIKSLLKFTNFKHIGIFPEQAANWEWITEKVKKIEKPNVLNLFGYTGIASIAAAQAGAFVTHVDASKQSNAWARENAELSGVSEGIRCITDDALKFAQREVRRGAAYDGIILDPPAFGRGAKGEVWRIEEDISKLLKVLEKLLAKKSGSFFVLNGYAAGYSPQSYLQAVEGVFNGTFSGGEFGELCIQESSSARVIPAGIYVRFVR